MRPGIIRNTTEYFADGGWSDGDKIRFRSSRPEKIGGWVRQPIEQDTDPTNLLFTGVARDIISWKDLSSLQYLAVATHQKVELLFGGKIFDITPVRANFSLNNIVSTFAASSIVNINIVNHGVSVGDFVFVNSQASPVDGITLSGEFVVTTITDLDNFEVDSGTVETGGAPSTGGGILDIDLLLENGAQSNGDLIGWGGGTWNTPGQGGLGWNNPRVGSGGLNLRQWSLDTFGEDLLACVREGQMFHWDATVGVAQRLQEISTLPSATSVPQENLFMLVSQPSRHIIAFGSEEFSSGTFDPLIIRWASQESIVDWDITNTNSAGEFRLPKGNTIIGAVQTRAEILVFTDTDVYSMRFVGGNEIFRFEPLGTNTSAISQHAAIDVNGLIFWMGLDDFYMYDGVIRPIRNTLDESIFDQDGEFKLNDGQKEKVFAGVNKEFHEIWWLFPQNGTEEIDRYVIYNYLEDLWYDGELNRTVWLDRSIFENPFAFDETGTLFAHENGKDDDGSALFAFIRSGYFDIGDGESLMFVDEILPDIKLPATKSVQISLLTKKHPHPRASIITKGPFTFDDSISTLKVRARGRQMSILYETNATGGDFELGKIRLAIQADGER